MIEDYALAGHTFGTIHDALVDDVTTGFAPLDAVTNIGTMAPEYATALISETINTTVDLINTIFGTDFDLSIEEFEKVIGDFVNDILHTFPEYEENLNCNLKLIEFYEYKL